jgi:hypothetical protein
MEYGLMPKDKDGKYLYNGIFCLTAEGTLCKVSDIRNNHIILSIVRIEQCSCYTEPVLGGQIMLDRHKASNLQVLPRNQFCWSPVATA